MIRIVISVLILLHKVEGFELNETFEFLNDFLISQGKPAQLVSFMKLTQRNNVEICNKLSRKQIFFKTIPRINTTKDKIDTECHKHHYYRGSCNIYEFINLTIPNYDHVVYLADLREKITFEVLKQAEIVNMILVPSRWILFYNTRKTYTDNSTAIVEVEKLLENVYFAINTEVYIVFEYGFKTDVYLVYNRCRKLELIWEMYGSWNLFEGFDRPHPTEALSMRRRNLHGAIMNSTAVLFHNESLHHMTDYLHREVDTLTKVLYYMTLHLFDWVNATGHIRFSKSWGYLKSDGTYDGSVRDLWDGHSDFSGSVMITMKERMPALNYILPPAPLNLLFIYRKPSLASIANIYELPFSSGVWIALVLLILVSSAALFCTSFREMHYSEDSKYMSVTQRLSQGFHDTLCLVFQQGTAHDPITISSRQILLLGLVAFMFLYTAYSANVVALLQSTTNVINSVESLLNSPLQCGAHDVIYNREIFMNEKRPIHRAFWLKKGLPQGENFFLSVEEGVRKIREGMFAFHVEPTAGYDQIKNTFLEHEKCNLGTVKYTDFLFPYIGVARNTHIKEVLRIGILRILESGVQSRTTRRVTSDPPQCSAGTAIFTAVSLMDVAPAFKALGALYAVSLALLVLELAVRNYGLRHPHQQSNGLEIENI